MRFMQMYFLLQDKAIQKATVVSELYHCFYRLILSPHSEQQGVVQRKGKKMSLVSSS